MVQDGTYVPPKPLMGQLQDWAFDKVQPYVPFLDPREKPQSQLKKYDTAEQRYLDAKEAFDHRVESAKRLQTDIEEPEKSPYKGKLHSHELDKIFDPEKRKEIAKFVADSGGTVSKYEWSSEDFMYDTTTMEEVSRKKLVQMMDSFSKEYQNKMIPKLYRYENRATEAFITQSERELGIKDDDYRFSKWYVDKSESEIKAERQASMSFVERTYDNIKTFSTESIDSVKSMTSGAEKSITNFIDNVREFVKETNQFIKNLGTSSMIDPSMIDPSMKSPSASQEMVDEIERKIANGEINPDTGVGEITKEDTDLVRQLLKDHAPPSDERPTIPPQSNLQPYISNDTMKSASVQQDSRLVATLEGLSASMNKPQTSDSKRGDTVNGFGLGFGGDANTILNIYGGVA